MQATNAYRLDIGPMGLDDLDAVIDIDRLSQPAPTSAHLFLAELERTWAFIDVMWATYLDNSTQTVAFCNYWLVDSEIQLHNLATHPDWRRRGLASSLLDHLLDVAHVRGCALVTL